MSKTEKPWFIDKRIQQAQFMNKVNQATLPGPVKDFLRYIASKVTWRHTTEPKKSYEPCYASQDTIEIQMGRSKDYVTKAKKEAIALGWVQVDKSKSSDRIYPVIGVNDPTVKVKVKRERWIREDIKPIQE